MQVDHHREDPGRVALRAAVTPPAGMTGDLIADACMAFTAEHAIPTGRVMGYNEKANLVAVGHSVYASEFSRHGADGAAALLATIVGAARAGEAALANARPAQSIAESDASARMRQLVPNATVAQEFGGLFAAFNRMIGGHSDAG